MILSWLAFVSVLWLTVSFICKTGWSGHTNVINTTWLFLAGATSPTKNVIIFSTANWGTLPFLKLETVLFRWPEQRGTIKMYFPLQNQEIIYFSNVFLQPCLPPDCQWTLRKGENALLGAEWKFRAVTKSTDSSKLPLPGQGEPALRSENILWPCCFVLFQIFGTYN